MVLPDEILKSPFLDMDENLKQNDESQEFFNELFNGRLLLNKL